MRLGASHEAEGRGIGVSLVTPQSVRKFQRKLYVAAKEQPERRFHQLYDKVYREDVLVHAYRLARSAAGAPGVDGARQ